MIHKLLLFIIVCLIGCGPTKSELTQLAPTEKYPDDTFLNSVTKKKALVVVAHDDDLVAMSGTISKLYSAGWEIREICLVSESSDRDSALVKGAKDIMSGIDFITIPPQVRRMDFDTVAHPYLPIPKERIPVVFKKDEIKNILIQKINSFQPTVIFSLDHELGGYGHPEHILISNLVIDLYQENQISPEKIYQSVYPNSMETKILKERMAKLMQKWGFPHSYSIATTMYNLSGMPEPTVQINIKDQAENKMKFLRSFEERERKTIGFFIPMFEDFSAEEYFGVFDREFFRVIDKP